MGRCFICLKEKKLGRHHIKPQSEGGNHDKRNLLRVCEQCHNIVEELSWKDIIILKKEYKTMKESRKTSKNEVPNVVLKRGEHLAWSFSEHKWKIWGMDEKGIYSVEIE